MEVYITKSNFNKILNSIKLNLDKIEDKEIYKVDLFFLNKKEKEKLLIQKYFLQNNKKIAQFEINNNFKNSKLVFISNKRSYHCDPECSALNSGFENYIIPDSIIDNGLQNEFREWCESNKIRELDEETIKVRIFSRFGVHVDKVIFENTGIEDFSVISSDQFENRIDDLIKKIGDYYKNADDKKKYVISKYQKLTYLAYKDKALYNNDTKYTDKAIKKFLKEYDENFKIPFKVLLKNYYISKYNPDLKFDKKILQKFNFTFCKKCSETDLSDYL